MLLLLACVHLNMRPQAVQPVPRHLKWKLFPARSKKLEAAGGCGSRCRLGPLPLLRLPVRL